jgi:hypothetical protein
MRRLMALVSIVVVSFVLAAWSGVSAQEATPLATETASELVLPSDAEEYGVSHAEWAARVAQWNYSFPFDDHPLNDPNPLACGAGQQGPVFFLGSVALPR